MKSVKSFLLKGVTSPYLSLIFRIYIGWIFIYAGLSKMAEPLIFAESVANYQIIPYWGLNIVTIFLPWLELVCGFYLILGLRTKATASILSSLLFLFTLFIVINIFRGSQMNCGCFDDAGDPIGWKKVIINSIWLLMTIQVLFFDTIHFFRRNEFSFLKKRSIPGS